MLARHAPTLVALWVVLHTASTCVSAVPDPRFAMKKDLWQDARVQSELHAWAEKLGADPESFESALWEFGTWATSAHALIDAPFVPYFMLSGNRQRWPMFGAGSPESDRYEVRARSCDDEDAACPWMVLYRTGSTEERFLADVIEAPRVRSLVSTASYRGHGAVRRRTCRAIAHAVFRARPELRDVECSFLRQTAPAPRLNAAPPVPEERERVVHVTRADVTLGMLR